MSTAKKLVMLMFDLDKWKSLRVKLNLFGNVEPEVKLIGITAPTELVCSSFTNPKGPYCNKIEQQVPHSAIQSTGADVKDYHGLTKNLLKLGHMTPFEAVQFNFDIDGISKACSAQMSRHRVGTGHVSSSRRYKIQAASFIYPLLASVDDADTVKAVYSRLSSSYEESFNEYHHLKASYKVKKGDLRYLIPVGSSTSRIMWINARALRHFFELRLPATAEEEIRRLGFLMLDSVMKVTPTLFEDIYASAVGKKFV